MKPAQPRKTIGVPIQSIGPLRMCFEGGDELLEIPLATYESPLWPSCARGAKVSEKSGGIQVTLIDERMSRSILLEAKDAGTAARLCADIKNRRAELEAEVEKTSRFAKLIDIHSQQVARLIYLRFEYSTGDAAGHNMTTKASDQLMSWITEQYSELDYVSISANFCTDKKPSAVNGILGRGKNVIAEMTIPEKIVRRFLKTTAAKVVDLNLKKNLIGTMLAGGLRSANAHFANMLLAFYLATGQDAANIVEGSQGFSYAEDRDGDLYFSVTLPNLIVGAIGNGKELDFVQENLSSLGCTEKREPGANSRRLAACCASVVLCGELSLLAAQTNPGELMEAHLKLERS